MGANGLRGPREVSADQDFSCNYVGLIIQKNRAATHEILFDSVVIAVNQEVRKALLCSTD